MNTKQRSSGSDRQRSVRGDSPNGFIFYEGKSVLDGEPIVGIATGISRPSANPKTGPMLQTWILRSDISPYEAVLSGKDASICGNCELRGNGKQRACYVPVLHGPQGVWHSYRDGQYLALGEVKYHQLRRQALRLGSYGDPVAIPPGIWFRLVASCDAHTGYTHHWRDPRFQVFRWILMASVDTPDEAWQAWKLGWRTFRIRLPEENLLVYESVCPASREAGYRATCEYCRQCNGTRAHDLRRSYTVIAHGRGAGNYRRSRLPIL